MLVHECVRMLLSPVVNSFDSTLSHSLVYGTDGELREREADC